DRAAEDLRDRDEQVFAAEWTDLFFDLAEPVRPHVRERAHAAPLRRLEALREQLDEAAAVIEARHRVFVHGRLDELLRRRAIRGLAWDAELDRGFAVVRRLLEQQRQLRRRSVAVSADDAERLAGPLSLHARNDRA